MDNRVSKRTLYRWAAGTKEPKQTSNIDSLYRLLKPEDSWMLYIKHVTSNIKKGVDVSLGERSLIYGPNGSGKSSVVQAIELATSGSVNDTEGRNSVKLKGAIARLFPQDEEPYVKLTLSDGQEINWSLNQDNSGIATLQIKVIKEIRAIEIKCG